MNGYTLAAVIIMCVTAIFITLVRAAIYFHQTKEH
jgi:hypothetical protein